MRRLLLLALLLVATPVWAATWTAGTCSYADVNTQVNTNATDGDTVIIPAGTCAWTSTLTITNKQLVLKGAGVGQTIIQDDLPRDGSFSANPLIDITINAPKKFRLSGIEIQSHNTYGGNGAFLLIVTGTSQAVRFDHFKIGALYRGNTIKLQGDLAFVADNCTAVNENILFQTGHAQFGQSDGEFPAGNWGDGSWSSVVGTGTARAIFIEDCTITQDGSVAITFTDTDLGGARYVSRFNTIQDAYHGSHGTESPGRTRGGRLVEIYRNILSRVAAPTIDTFLIWRSGSALMFDNTISGCSGCMGTWLTMKIFRAADSLGGWGVADGTGSWDSNDAAVYVTGTATAGTTTDSLVDSSKNFTTACGGGTCLAYSLRDLTSGKSSIIDGVTATTLTTRASIFGGGSSHVYASGDSYQIRRVIYAIDQPGRGKSRDLSGVGNPPSGSTGDPLNALEPLYVFNNTGTTPVFGTAGPDTPWIVANRDWYQDDGASCSGASCTTGVGRGVRSARPATCTAGVAWWSTDQGSWNTKVGGVQGVLDKCTSTNTWTNSAYVPYTYPHPLRSDVFVGDSPGVPPNISGGLSLPMRK